MAYRTSNRAEGDLSQLSPDKPIRRLSTFRMATSSPYSICFPDLIKTDLSSIDKIAVPLILIEGRHDRNVNSDIAVDWFERVKAPEKHLIWFEHSGTCQ